MLVFPQLTTGAAALYPVTKKFGTRTVVNTLEDASTVVYEDADGAVLGWELQAKGLTQAEWNAIETLLESTAGMWQTFTLLDPVGNLLAESEDYSATAWTNGALIELTAGASDPFGTTRATTAVNAGEAALTIAQTLNVPANYQYCLSVWLRGSTGTAVTLSLGTLSETVTVGAAWKRFALSGNPGLAAETLTFAVELPAGAAVDLFGVQAEAQIGPSDYKMTGVTGGVYSSARFASDQLTVTALGTDVFDATISLVNSGS